MPADTEVATLTVTANGHAASIDRLAALIAAATAPKEDIASAERAKAQHESALKDCNDRLKQRLKSS